MGPRSNDRGNTSVPWAGTWLVEQLQWGRDQMIAEIYGGPFSLSVRVELQWGRDQLIAEIDPRFARRLAYVYELQWGRDQLIAEIPSVLQRAGRVAPRFNGAAIN